MIARNFRDEDWTFESGARVSCKNSPGISLDGKYIYYFVDKKLYREKTTKSPQPEEVSLSVKMPAPTKKIKPRFVFYALGEDFLLFHGNGGVYNLYSVNSAGKIAKISGNIMSSMVFPAFDEKAYLISGTIGKMRLRKVSKEGNRFKIDSGFHIGYNELNSWQISKNEFVTGNNKGLYYRKLGSDLKRYPVVYKRFWVLKKQILYENQEGELYLSDFTYSDEDWKLVKLLEKSDD